MVLYERMSLKERCTTKFLERALYQKIVLKGYYIKKKSLKGRCINFFLKWRFIKHFCERALHQKISLKGHSIKNSLRITLY